MNRLASSALRKGIDPITGLINGNEMMLVIRDHIDLFRRGGGCPPKLIFLDIDRFGGLASMLGEQGIGELLRAFSARLLGAVGRDGVVARGSGDRFFVLFENEAVRDRLVGLFDPPLTILGRAVYAPTSGGAVRYPTDAEGPLQLVRCATLALKWAKRFAPGRIIDFEEGMREDATRARLIENGMREVINDPGKEFRLLYQPKILLETGRLIGVEALMRWDATTVGPVGPSEFIPVAEATHLIVPLGRWLTDTAFQTVKNWREAGYEIELSINVSPVELNSPNFVTELDARRAFYGLRREMIEIEITESHIASDLVVERILRLRRLGYLIAIDDFGRDQSNLSRVVSLPATTLKIDKSVTDGVLHDPRQALVIRSVISLAADLGLRSVVEGLETHDQAVKLREIGANCCQGFYGSRPIDANDIIRMIQVVGLEHYRAVLQAA